MIVTQITASFDRKMTDNNYGSCSVFCSISAALDEADDVEASYDELYKQCKRMVYDRLERKRETTTTGAK